MRLDQYVSKKLDISKSRAQQLISSGQVTVNGAVTRKKGCLIKDKLIEIAVDHTYPYGYHKLAAIFDALDLMPVSSESTALDIGSSAGGFLSFYQKNGIHATGLEYSKEFQEQLVKQGYSVLLDDAFTYEPEKSYDFISIDVTTETDGTCRLIEHYFPYFTKAMIVAFKDNPANMHSMRDRIAYTFKVPPAFTSQLVRAVSVSDKREYHVVITSSV